METDICLFLTGTITPKGVPDLKRIDPIERENDYYEAINKWLQLGYPLVFCENSNTTSGKIYALLDAAPQQTEYISFASEVSHLGKGHGEAEIFSYAFNNSDILNSCFYVCKATGRYFIRNAAQLLNSAEGEEGIDVIANLSRNITWADSRFFIAKLDFYHYTLSKCLSLIDESKHIYFEHVLAKAIHLKLAEGGKWDLLPFYPEYEGVYGTSNINYSNSLFKKLKFKIFHFVKKWCFQHQI